VRGSGDAGGVAAAQEEAAAWLAVVRMIRSQYHQTKRCDTVKDEWTKQLTARRPREAAAAWAALMPLWRAARMRHIRTYKVYCITERPLEPLLDCWIRRYKLLRQPTKRVRATCGGLQRILVSDDLAFPPKGTLVAT